jgi:hypothetical protein
MKKEKIIQTQLVIVTGLLILYYFFKAEAFLYSALSFALIVLVFPGAGKWLVTIWFRLGGLLGKLNGYVLLTLIFYLILTPVALLNRIFSKDPLRLKKKDGSYFHDRSHTYSAKDISNPW